MAKTQKAGKKHNSKPKGKGRGRKQRGGKTHTQKGGGVFGFLPELTGSPNVMRHYPNISQETCEFDPLSVGVLRPSPLQLQAGGSRGYSVLDPVSNPVDLVLSRGTYAPVIGNDSGECGCDTSTFDNNPNPLVGGKRKKKTRGKKGKRTSADYNPKIYFKRGPNKGKRNKAAERREVNKALGIHKRRKTAKQNWWNQLF